MNVESFARKERREDPRIPINFPVRFHIAGKQNPQNSVIKDLSMQGLCLATSDFLPKESLINLELPIKGILYNMNISGKVAWTKSIGYANSYRAGIQFQNIDKKNREVLNEYLQLQNALT